MKHSTLTTRWLSYALVGAALTACAQNPVDPNDPPVEGQSEFESAPAGGSSRGGGAGGASTGASADAASAPSADASAGGGDRATTERRVEETDLYRVDGNTLYVLNGYRGLMVFDITNVDAPRLLGRAPLYGQPVDMVVRNGVAYAIVADWYGSDDEGEPYYGSVVYAIDARDPSNPRLGRSARVRGWIRDARVVGDVLYTVSDGWEETTTGGSSSYGGRVAITSVRISSPDAVAVAGQRIFEGYSGIFNVTANAILMAHTADTGSGGGWAPGTDQSQVDYVDITDPNGAINLRGSVRVPGSIQGWGANNGRFNIDFDGRYVRALSMTYGTGGSGEYRQTYVLSTLDAQDPNRISMVSSVGLTTEGWSPAARFDRGRMYLSPQGGWGSTESTPVQVYDVSNPAAPRLVGSASVEGTVWNFIPAGDRLFALGQRYSSGTGTGYPYDSSSQIALRYLDVRDPASPRVLGVSEFGAGWAWTPAAGDFKAFAMDASRGLVVLPFSGWDYRGRTYQNGLQMIEFTGDSLSTAGTARTRGWVERGIFVRDRLVSLSDTALTVVDYTNRREPRTVTELTLAHNVVQTQPMGDTTVQLTTDWYEHDQSTTLRVLPTSDPDDTHLTGALATLTLRGTSPRMFRQGNLAYVITVESVEDPTCGGRGGSPYGGCTTETGRIQVVDLADARRPRLRGTLDLPARSRAYYWGCFGGWYGFGWYGWWDGESVVQVGDALALREPGEWTYDGTTSRMTEGRLHVVNLANPDAPSIASTSVMPAGREGWWGGLNYNRASGKLYLSHYEYVGAFNPEGRDRVRYFLDEVDLSDRANPRIGSRVNIPGIFIGASDDGRFGYTVDYRWGTSEYGGYTTTNMINAVEFSGGRAYLRSSTPVDGYLGNVQVRSGKLYFTTQRWDSGSYRSREQLHMLDLRDASHPVDRVAPETRSYGYLLGVEGDIALVSTGYGSGVGMYRLSDDMAPRYLGSQRTRGWWANNVSRQGDVLFLSTGYWGVQTISVR